MGSRSRPDHYEVGKKGWRSREEPVPGNPQACLEELGVQVDYVKDDEIYARCPKHWENLGKQDKGGHWSVNVNTGDHNCFACGFRGPFVLVVEEMLNCDRDDAVSWVKERGSIERARMILSGEYITDLNEPEKITEADLALMIQPPDWACEERVIDPDIAAEYGVLWDPEHDYWIIPIRDPWTGELWGWQEKGHKHFYNFPEHMQKSKTLFGIHQCEPGDTIFLVESPLDVLVLASLGYKAVATFGAQISQVQMEILAEFTTRLVIALDNDEEGENSARGLQKWWSNQFRLRYFNYGRLRAKDPGEMDDDEIHEAIRTAVSGVLMRFDD